MSWPALVAAASLLASGCTTSTGAVRPIGLNQETELAPGQSVQSGPLRVTFKSVGDDSRCPADVVCVWEGDAQVRVDVREESGETVSRELHTSGNVGSSSIEHGGFTIALVRLSPEAHTQRPIPAQDYRLVLKITQPS
jgi:hypothetical protein